MVARVFSFQAALMRADRLSHAIERNANCPFCWICRSRRSPRFWPSSPAADAQRIGRGHISPVCRRWDV